MSDIDAIMQEAASDQTHPDWFVSSDINYIRRNLSECGITAIARTAEGEAAGFFIIELPEGGVDELADFLGFTEEQKQHTAIMDTAVVTRRFRGYGLQGGAGIVHRKNTELCDFFTNRVYFILWNKEKLSMTMTES